jgi:bifunctional non-homologous end joining protein LigD
VTPSRQQERQHKRLERYESKRDFAITPEPRGGRPAEAGNRFVVQRHRARQLHYDLRLEMDGVLASWAVPRGPTLDPSARRMAVHVEDHPLEYFDFEGVIPRGEYGGGDVIVWDWGTWTAVGTDDPASAVDAGELRFELVGEKLRGRFALVRTGSPGEREQWLLIHKRDDAASDGWDPEQFPRSVRSGRTNDEVAADPDDTWTAARETVAPWARRLQFEPLAADELAALDEIGVEGTWEIAGIGVRLTNLDKPLFPSRTKRGKSLTKRDLVRHHATVAPAMLPYLAGRPVNPHRFPNGVDQPGYWYKAIPAHAPDWITRYRHVVADGGETKSYAVVDSIPGLVWMANYGAVELHPWTSLAAAPHEPTWALVDIDPGPRTTFADVRDLALLFRAALAHLQLLGCPKVSGQQGIQIWIPVAAGYSFDETRAWVEALSRAVGASLPELVSWSWRKADRDGKARLDYTQNAINKTLVAPFSARPAPGAPVSVPIRWDELDDRSLKPDRWTITSLGRRFAEAGDPLRELIGLQQRLPSL